MSFLPNNEEDQLKNNRITRSAGNQHPLSAIEEGLLAGNNSSLGSDLEMIQRQRSIGGLALANEEQLSEQSRYLNSTGLRERFFEERINQTLQFAVGSRSREEQEINHPPDYRRHSPYEHDLGMRESMYGTRDILPPHHRPQHSATTQSFYGPPPRQDSRWGMSDNRTLHSMSRQRPRSDEEIQLLLRRKKEQIRHQTEWVDALHREAAKRRKSREDAARREWQAVSQHGVGRYSHLVNGMRQHEEDLQTLPAKRLRLHHDNLSITQTLESDRHHFSQRPLLGQPVETRERLINDQTTLSMFEQLRKERADLFGRLGGRESALSKEAETTDTQKTARERSAVETTGRETAAVKEEPPRNKKPSAKSSGGEAVLLSSPLDKGLLSEYQRLTRESIELFEIQPEEILLGVQGRRNTCIEAGQVGLRCRHCKHRPPHWRGQGAVYFPGSLRGVYQASQNMAANHFLSSCDDMPPELREQFIASREKQLREARRSGGISYWVKSCELLGVEERPNKKGLWFR